MNVDDDTVIIMTAGEPIQDDDANTIIRHSINFPPGLYRTLQERAKKQYRSMSSIVLEACDFYLSGDIEEQTIQFLNSEKGRNLIKQINSRMVDASWSVICPRSMAAVMDLLSLE